MRLRSKLIPLLIALSSLTGAIVYLTACVSKPPVSHPGPGVGAAQLLSEVRLIQDLIPAGRYGRRYYRPMYPRYITIHSTQNYTGDAHDHARALKVGALRAHQRPGGNRIGFLAWHFTVQDNLAIQHIPTREQGEHADFDGPGNNHSVGIEMCEHRGNSFPQTMQRTAKLTATLMKQYNIPLNNVVPHYHWPRAGASPPNKACPLPLMDNGRPGRKWAWFLQQVRAQYQRLP